MNAPVTGNPVTLEDFAAVESAALDQQRRDPGRYFTRAEIQLVSPFGEAGTTDLFHMVSEICQETGCAAEDLLGPSIDPFLARKRWLIWVKLHQMGHTQAKIARWFGRHSSTVCVGIKQMRLILEDAR